MNTFRKGDDFLEKGKDNKTFGIHNEEWGNQIEVYGNKDLRDRILRLLQEDEDTLKAERDAEEMRETFLEDNRQFGLGA